MKKYKMLSLRYEEAHYKLVVKAIRKRTGKRNPNVSGWIKELVNKEIVNGNH